MSTGLWSTEECRVCGVGNGHVLQLHRGLVPHSAWLLFSMELFSWLLFSTELFSWLLFFTQLFWLFSTLHLPGAVPSVLWQVL